jgi:methionine sulfoxide reductase heme-binding subunit
MCLSEGTGRHISGEAVRKDQWAGPKRRSYWLIAVAIAGALVICGAAAMASGDFTTRLSLATRLTARWSALWFLAAFTARPLFRMLGSVWAEPLRQRRYIGLGFAGAHTIHGIAFVTLIGTGGASRPLIVWIVGGIGYLLMWAMAATSNDGAMRAMGRHWRRLHLTGMWWLWVVFTYSYGGRMFRPGTEALGVGMTALFVAAALIRLPWLHAGKSRKAL